MRRRHEGGRPPLKGTPNIWATPLFSGADTAKLGALTGSPSPETSATLKDRINQGEKEQAASFPLTDARVVPAHNRLS
jgi:hypothetical protein